ncbi:hypothetical protein EYF80_034086 [Liparis tanakae]|uniref:Uncharacterized protein n=1 Tax=Liparis tanakae TaxID=230148 RepID=A0A4Z2GQZ8_9TELE|nr:hypothetical protein EYF80_034086 [Liparis tanakae]
MSLAWMTSTYWSLVSRSMFGSAVLMTPEERGKESESRFHAENRDVGVGAADARPSAPFIPPSSVLRPLDRFSEASPVTSSPIRERRGDTCELFTRVASQKVTRENTASVSFTPDPAARRGEARASGLERGTVQRLSDARLDAEAHIPLPLAERSPLIRGGDVASPSRCLLGADPLPPHPPPPLLLRSPSPGTPRGAGVTPGERR